MGPPCTQLPIPMDLPQGPPVLAAPSAQGCHLYPARRVLPSACATLARERPPPPCCLPRAARHPQNSSSGSARSAAPSPLQGQGQRPLTPPLRSLQGKPSSPGFTPARSKQLLQCLLWHQQVPPSQLDPGEKQRLGRRGIAAHSPALWMRPQPRRTLPRPPRSCLSHPRDHLPVSSPCPLPIHSHPSLGGHRDPQGQGLHIHVQSRWRTTPSSSFLAQ